MLIRDANDEDWDVIWPFFREIVQSQETYAYEPDTSYDEGRALWMERPPSRTAVAVDDDGTVLGSSKMGPNRPGPGAHIGTASFMVSPSAQGRGVGRALAEDMVRWHRAQGFHGIQFNAVVETNTTAVRLWQELGFTIVGTVPDAFRHPKHGLVGLHVMYLPLTTGDLA
jgi:L-amino acid N-acyltransferase YncA